MGAGAAWAMLGLAEAAQIDLELAATAKRVADWWLAHLPADGVSTATLDTSATAIAAAALVTLGRHAAARAAVDALRRHVSSRGELVNGCYDRAGRELVFGDYFLLEAALAA